MVIYQIKKLNKVLQNKDNFVTAFLYSLKTFGDFSRLLDVYAYRNSGVEGSNTILVTCDTFLKNIANYANVPYIYGNPSSKEGSGKFTFYNKGDADANAAFIIETFNNKLYSLMDFKNQLKTTKLVEIVNTVYQEAFDYINGGGITQGRSRSSKKFIGPDGTDISVDDVKELYRKTALTSLFLVELIMLDRAIENLENELKEHQESAEDDITFVNRHTNKVNQLLKNDINKIIELSKIEEGDPLNIIDNYLQGRISDDIEYTIEHQFEWVQELYGYIDSDRIGEDNKVLMDSILTTDKYKFLSMNNLEDIGILDKIYTTKSVFINPVVDTFVRINVRDASRGGSMRGGTRKSADDILQSYFDNMCKSTEQAIKDYSYLVDGEPYVKTLEDLFLVFEDILASLTIVSDYLEFENKDSSVNKLLNDVLNKMIDIMIFNISKGELPYPPKPVYLLDATENLFRMDYYKNIIDYQEKIDIDENVIMPDPEIDLLMTTPFENIQHILNYLQRERHDHGKGTAANTIGLSKGEYHEVETPYDSGEETETEPTHVSVVVAKNGKKSDFTTQIFGTTEHGKGKGFVTPDPRSKHGEYRDITSGEVFSQSTDPGLFGIGGSRKSRNKTIKRKSHKKPKHTRKHRTKQSNKRNNTRRNNKKRNNRKQKRSIRKRN